MRKEMKGRKNVWRTWLSTLLIATLVLAGCGKTAEVATEETKTAETEAESKQETQTQEVDENAENVNMLENGDFSKHVEHWGTYMTKEGGAEFKDENEQGIINVKNTGGAEYSVQIYYDGFKLKMGGVYEFSFDMASTLPRNIEARIQINGSDYHAYVIDNFDVTSDMATYTLSFTMTEGTDPAPRLCFNLGTPVGSDKLEEHTITLDNVSVCLKDGSQIVEIVEENKEVDCNTNQVGYLPNARKTVVIRSENPGSEFSVVDASNKEVYKGSLSQAIESTSAGEKVYIGDFSELTTPGEYKVVSADGKESYPFTIGEDVYNDLLKDSFRMMYLQRCGMELTSDMAGDFAHPVCHNSEAVIYGTSEKKDVSGGWHDAGDYGRYVVSGVETVMDLLMSYEDYPDIWNGADADAFDIPESGNGIPDILDEAKYELDWLLKMQDETSGGVYHKVSCKDFPGFVMPQEETDELVLSPISTAATADFAAIMAKSSVIYKDIDAAYAETCYQASLKAWGYLEQTKNVTGFHNPEDILTGEYKDAQDRDERFWASVELYNVTKDKKYIPYITELLDQFVLHGFGWANMGSYGNVAYMRSDLKDPEYAELIQNDVIKKADELLENANKDGYLVSLGDSFVWGSNMVVSNNARQLLFAEELSGNAAYGVCAYDQMSYLLGQNTLSYCYLTGYGSVSPKHPHHRPSMATGKVIKGMVIGGPDSALEDPLVKSTLAEEPPARCYTDNDQSFSTNEVTIYWNSPFVYLLSAEMSKNK